MGAIEEPKPVKLFVGMLASTPERLEEAEGILVNRYGPVDVSSEVLPFEYTDYYREEMGANLKRKFVSFERLIRPDDIIDIKHATNAIEADFAHAAAGEPRRPVNLDPGYLTLSKVVLATTKEYAHRVYLGRGIYAEVTLRFRHGRYEPWEWTYPDYRTPEYGEFFVELRERLREHLRSA
ncbi:MAG: hypothetical protein AMS16_02925 [Planctomycetes bacterium DG_58]|nr:MAG: hypothetical protein AMS16_02925 [Planctomycetes bacterium DG_58]